MSADQVGEQKPSFPRRVFFIILGSFSRLLYHQLAWSYDTVSALVSVGSWKKWVESLSAYIGGPNILEIGFGPGHLQAALHRKQAAVYGLDESSQMTTITKRRLVKRGFLPKLVRGEAQRLPFKGESFHQVVLTFPAEFIFQAETLAEIKRVLVPRGSALIVPMAWITGRKPWERLAARVNRIIGEAPEWDPRMIEPLKRTGFDVSWEMVEFTNSKIVLVRLIKI